MYSPKIKPELVMELYRLKQVIKRPMTKLVNEAVTEYLLRRKRNENKPEMVQDSG